MDPVVMTEFSRFAAQNGPWAAMCLALGLGSFWLVRWTLSESSTREAAMLASCDRREAALNLIIDHQNVVIERQSQTVTSQSEALNRITDRIDALSRSFDRIQGGVKV